MTRDSADMRRYAGLVGLVVFLVALLAVDAKATYGARISVDEPQYLLTALSLGEDFDLDISDELADERYRSWHQVELRPQTVVSSSGERLSPHDPGLPLILAPPMRIAGWVGVRIAMAALAAVAAGLTVVAAHWRFGVSATTAALVSAALFVTPPLVAYGNQIYPAMAAAVAILVGFLAVDGPGLRWQVAGVLAIVALPWLAIKYAPHAALVAAWFLWARRSDRRLLATLVALLGCAAIVYLVFHQSVYGGWTVYSVGNHFADQGEWKVVGENIDVVGRTRRLVGLFVDRNFGLAAWQPVYLAAPAALIWLVRHRRPRALMLASLVGVGWAMATWVALTMHGWWWPGRQVVPVLPLLVIAIAAFVDGRRYGLLALLGLSVASLGTWLFLVVEASTGRRTLIVDFFETANPLYRSWRLALPDHAGFSLQSPVLTLLWTALLVGSCVFVSTRSHGNAGR